MKLKDIETIDGLLRFYSKEKSANAVSILLLFTAIIPLIILVFYSFLFFLSAENVVVEFVLQFFDFYDLNYVWHILVQIAGYLLLVFSFIELFRYRICIKFENNKINSSSAIVAICISFLFFWCLLSALNASATICFFGSEVHHEGISTYIAYLGFFFSTFFLSNQIKIEKFSLCFLLSAAVVMLPIALKSRDVYIFFHINYTIGSSIFSNSNHSGYYNCIAVMIAAVFFLISYESGNNIKLVYFIFFLYFIFVQLQNGSFGSYLGEFIGLLVFALLCSRNYYKNGNRDNKQSKNKKICLFSIFLLLCFIAESCIFSIFDQWVVKDILSFFPSIYKLFWGTNTEKNKVGSGRGILYIRALQFIKEKPLFGYGPDNLGKQFKKYGILELERVHCVPLNIAASEGIPAALFYLGALFSFFVSFIKTFRNLDIMDIGLFSIGTAYFCSSLVGNSSYYVTPYFCIIFGLAAGRIARMPQAEKTSEDKENAVPLNE